MTGIGHLIQKGIPQKVGIQQEKLLPKYPKAHRFTLTAMGCVSVVTWLLGTLGLL
jgi:hypothetical protein